MSEGLLHKSDLINSILESNTQIKTRALSNFKSFTIDSKELKVAQPVTFTPYASAKPCSARCQFCSENLVLQKNNKVGQSLRPSFNYHDKLLKVLNKLMQIPMGISLSGLEISDDPDWLVKTVQVLKKWEELGGVWTERAAYTNGNGFSTKNAPLLIQALKQIDIERLEVSRHHFSEAANQKIMKFRDSYEIKHGQVFENTVRNMLEEGLPVTLICILQKNGIESNKMIAEYLNWSRTLGVKKVIFRELCEVPSIYRENSTFNYINSNRISIEPFVKEWLTNGVNIQYFENDYYFWNAVFKYKGQKIIFERSDYSAMKEKHNSDVIYKFVYFANGNLCYDWDPESVIIGR